MHSLVNGQWGLDKKRKVVKLSLKVWICFLLTDQTCEFFFVFWFFLSVSIGVFLPLVFSSLVTFQMHWIIF